MEEKEVDEVKEVNEVEERRDVRVKIGWTTETLPPGFWAKSAEGIGRTADRCDTENERVRKPLKRKRAESGNWEERERKCRRADIFGVGHPPVFA
jgi:hypothetical protein